MRAFAVVFLAFVVTTAAQAQSLADAAARAEEQRRSVGPASRTLTNDSLPGEWAITTAGLEQYANARTELASIRHRHADVHSRLWNASMNAGILADLEPALVGEPLVVAALASFGLTPRDYLRREQALRRAEWSARGGVGPDVGPDSTRWANIVYLQQARRIVDALERRYRVLEGEDIWWESWRFAQD